MPFEEEGEGRCINCGFVGKRGREPHDSAWWHASRRDRIAGTFFMAYPGSGHYDTVPACFVGAANLLEEVMNLPIDNDEANTHQTLTKDRACTQWYPWREFLTPAEHLYERDMKQLENDRREFERRLVQMEIDAQKRTGRVGLWIGIAAIIFAVAEVTAAVLGLTSESWVVKLFR